MIRIMRKSILTQDKKYTNIKIKNKFFLEEEIQTLAQLNMHVNNELSKTF